MTEPTIAPDPQPRVYGGDLVQAALEAAVAHRGVHIYRLDTRYWALTQAGWDRVIADHGRDRTSYTPERYDCDDYAFAYKGSMGDEYRLNGVGLVIDWSGKHAYNCLVVAPDDPGGLPEVHFLEPQTDGWVRVGPDHPQAVCYTLASGIIII